MAIILAVMKFPSAVTLKRASTLSNKLGGYVLFLLHQSPKPDTKNVLASPREFATHNIKKQEVNDAAMGGRVGGAVAE